MPAASQKCTQAARLLTSPKEAPKPFLARLSPTKHCHDFKFSLRNIFRLQKSCTKCKKKKPYTACIRPPQTPTPRTSPIVKTAVLTLTQHQHRIYSSAASSNSGHTLSLSLSLRTWMLSTSPCSAVGGDLRSLSSRTPGEPWRVCQVSRVANWVAENNRILFSRRRKSRCQQGCFCLEALGETLSHASLLPSGVCWHSLAFLGLSTLTPLSASTHFLSAHLWGSSSILVKTLVIGFRISLKSSTISS